MKFLKRHWPLLTVVLISLLPLTALIKPGIYWAHDSESHLVRVAAFYQSLKEGNIIPRWAGDLNAGYGHPVLMFLYPLPSYFASLIHFLGFSFAGSIKLLLGLSYLSSGIFMYLWLRRHFSKEAALVGSAVWQLAPYRFVNLYVRNALGEHTAFSFIPLLLLSLHSFVTKPSLRSGVAVSVSLAGLILAHNAVSLMFLPFAALYTLILLWKKSSSTLMLSWQLFLAVVLGFSLSAFFWLPAFFEGKYTLRDIVTDKDEFARHFPTVSQLIVPSWGYGVSYEGQDDDLSFQIGLGQWFMFIAGVVALIQSKKVANTNRLLGLLAVTVFLSSVFLLLDVSTPVWRAFTILKKFQFPWRLLIIPVFASSILAALATTLIRHSRKVIIAILVTLLVQNFNYWKPRGDYLPPEAEIIKDYLGTTDTGESTPIWAVRFQEKQADNILGVVHGAPITYDIIRRESEVHEQTITATVPTQIAENTLYFPGWSVYVNGEKKGIIWTDANWRGVITYPVPEGKSYVKVVFEDTRLRKITNAVTLASLIVVVILLVTPKILMKRNYQT
ncbi:MAG: glycosyltransferase family 39 protein [Candidatus Chisholmbacteria bacterium]|nr:glycosyltransferase family 39 protein [Candidatus Chisholmbacteria bacterium]